MPHASSNSASRQALVPEVTQPSTRGMMGGVAFHDVRRVGGARRLHAKLHLARARAR